MFTRATKPSLAIRAAKLLARDSTLVLIRFAPDFEAVEVVHPDNMSTRKLLEDAQMALVRCLDAAKS